jgi:hypothetical protein
MWLIEQYGATLTADEPGVVRVESPAGYVWIDGAAHAVVATRWSDVAERIACGLETCD